jgi:hypothetical protein
MLAIKSGLARGLLQARAAAVKNLGPYTIYALSQRGFASNSNGEGVSEDFKRALVRAVSSKSRPQVVDKGVNKRPRKVKEADITKQ